MKPFSPGAYIAPPPTLQLLTFTLHQMTVAVPSTFTCLKCQVAKPWANFGKDPQKKTGHRPYCKECVSASQKTPEAKAKRNAKLRQKTIDRQNATPKLLDKTELMIGLTFGRLTVLSRGEPVKNCRTTVVCRCLCGKEITRPASVVRLGRTVSCGCYRNEKREMARIKRASKKKRFLHGHNRNAPTPTYMSWNAMRTRCVNPSHVAYKHYGGRGITVCERWNDFSLFLADMGERPENTSIDRIDVNGNYEPGNCRWADAKTQARNKRKSQAGGSR